MNKNYLDNLKNITEEYLKSKVNFDLLIDEVEDINNKFCKYGNLFGYQKIETEKIREELQIEKMVEYITINNIKYLKYYENYKDWKYDDYEFVTNIYLIPESFLNIYYNFDFNEYDKYDKSIKNNGHKIKEIDLFDTDLSLSTYYILATAEASSNLARFDGIRYGYRNNEQIKLNDFYIKNRSEGFGEEVKKRILLGTFVLSSGYFDAYYTKAKKIQNFIKNKFNEIFNNVDLIIMPVTPTTAFEFDKKLSTLQMYLEDIYTTPINIAGIPAMSIPLSKTKKRLPTALQIISSNDNEQNIFNLGLNIENLLKKDIK